MSSHYQTLGVPVDERSSAIGAAYRDLQRCCYPGRTPGGTRFFADLVHAFNVLEPARRRAAYDAGLHQPEQQARARSSAEQVDFIRLDLMRDFEGERPSHAEVFETIRRNYSCRWLPKSERQLPLDLEIVVPSRREQMTDLRLDVPVFHPCPTCHGAGHSSEVPCSSCDQHGLQQKRDQLRFGVPRAVRTDRVFTRSLRRQGIHNLYLRVRFRVSTIH